MLNNKSKKIFDFLRRTTVDFNMADDMPRLIEINPSEAVDFLFRKYGSF